MNQSVGIKKRNTVWNGSTTSLSQIQNRFGGVKNGIMSLILLGVTMGWPSGTVSQAVCGRPKQAMNKILHGKDE